MIAGFALGLSEGLSLEETLRRASAISAAAAMREEIGLLCDGGYGGSSSEDRD